MPDFPGEAFTADDLGAAAREQAEAAAEEAGLEPGTPQFDAAVLDFAVTGDPAFFEGAATAPDAQAMAPVLNLDDQARDIFRFFNTEAKGHFFTINESERDFVQENLPDYDFEGVGFEALPPDADNGVSTDVFRFFNTEARGHFFTTSAAERDFVEDNLPQFQPEGVGFEAFSSQVEGTVPVFRFFNTVAEGHFFTTSTAERDFVQENLPQYDFEGVGFYAFPDAVA
ncbi:MAG: hypothetical protein GVY13_09190 [Alphaproteobacteria bacterium]|jgi:hypothetical protein|nr:hypothetical protein [Alphaproteobacteria bacterium]